MNIHRHNHEQNNRNTTSQGFWLKHLGSGFNGWEGKTPNDVNTQEEKVHLPSVK